MKSEKEMLQLMDSAGKKRCSITLTPERPGVASYIRSNKFAKDKSTAGALEDGMKAFDRAFKEYYEKLKKIDPARAKKVLTDLARYVEEQ